MPEVTFFRVSGHDYYGGEHNADRCKLCILIAEVQLKGCTPETCDLCREQERPAEAERPKESED